MDTGRPDRGEAEVSGDWGLVTIISVSFRFDDILQRFMAQFVAHRMSGTEDEDGNSSEMQGEI